MSVSIGVDRFGRICGLAAQWADFPGLRLSHISSVFTANCDVNSLRKRDPAVPVLRIVRSADSSRCRGLNAPVYLDRTSYFSIVACP